MYNILIVDDEKDIVNALKIYLNNPDYQLFEAYNGKEALTVIGKEDIHLVLLDLMMPVMDGITAMARIREFSNVPIILLTAKSEDTDKILGLNVGADDYITKPYSLNVLFAKVKAVLNRYESTEKKSGNVLIFGDIKIDIGSGIVFKAGHEVSLTAMEYKLLTYLANNRNKVISKEEIFNNVWDDSFVSDGTLNVHIRHLREKLEDDPNEPVYIKTARGRGYLFKAEG